MLEAWWVYSVFKLVRTSMPEGKLPSISVFSKNLRIIRVRSVGLSEARGESSLREVPYIFVILAAHPSMLIVWSVPEEVFVPRTSHISLEQSLAQSNV